MSRTVLPMDSRSAQPSGAAWSLRLARTEDIEILHALITMSARVLQAPYYTSGQIEAALGPIFGVDRQLIEDGTYFVAETKEMIVGCGGWSRRRSLYGSDQGRGLPDPELDPGLEPARVRAFFVHPQWARKGIGRALLVACENAIRNARFQSITLVATLAGEPLYGASGYVAGERYSLTLGDGLGLPVVKMSKCFGTP